MALEPYLLYPLITLTISGIISLIVVIVLNQRYQQASNQLNTENALLAQRLEDISNDKAELQLTLKELQVKSDLQQEHITKLTTRFREVQVQLHNERQRGEERLAQQAASEQKLTEQFERLSQRIYAEETAKFKSLNRDSLELLLNPLQQQLAGFKSQVTETYNNEAKERFSLKVEVEKLANLNQRMVEEAANLTQALKGDNKQQGNWGEVILQRILEDSGLREGHEYHIQQSLKNEYGRRYQPDVIVHLPKGKDIVVDSKVSLTAYERFFNADSEAAKKQALNEHVVSVRSHIKGLGQKDYHKLQGVKTLDYVLLFIAVEPAFLLAVQEDPSLVKTALDNNILLASPANLMIALRTIENLWRYQRQEDNSQLIAQKAGKLYEKLRLFSEDLLEVGMSIDKAQASYQRSFKRFSQGRGNVVQQAEQLKSLGAEVNKSLPSQLLDEADVEDIAPASTALFKVSE
ncbi:DNA recombination protein RmuC [Motilimonas cestriensis]|uniref:DNA recombination protein RmuC n=1 Tax=Motilimonas cestriensis TaxID=2742685 RepID=A0ABS8W5H7_9GAMM|nr:DNA recombination protein RmuC [Motilimonas cestriensis]MCE2594232.1 DNA recombination protein RmuC [Motilimonas cestriensis]